MNSNFEETVEYYFYFKIEFLISVYICVHICY